MRSLMHPIKWCWIKASIIPKVPLPNKKAEEFFTGSPLDTKSPTKHKCNPPDPFMDARPQNGLKRHAREILQ